MSQSIGPSRLLFRIYYNGNGVAPLRWICICPFLLYCHMPHCLPRTGRFSVGRMPSGGWLYVYGRRREGKDNTTPFRSPVASGISFCHYNIPHSIDSSLLFVKYDLITRVHFLKRLAVITRNN